ncbi:DUF3566 domain-containing protein [Isoptericola variabilis]|uniref:Putative FHA domain containing protein n=1 Tax=Isoptericola variabilis (strain 225) TaxID=743718 RepID=F6FQ74_ISOV2|nr:DUF3566 domain-containing protein [Isoptericola variabilis]AEG42827.1 putative FHA domain containing protein [Isoptericola variabilis 225]TWH33741.1 transmembrane protein DUF3566 [Isoptericola variabilis J7]
MTSEKSAPSVARATSGRSAESSAEPTQTLAPVPAPPPGPVPAPPAADVPDDTTVPRRPDTAHDGAPAREAGHDAADSADATDGQGEGAAASMKAGAVKAAAAALAAAKSAAKKVQTAATATASSSADDAPASGRTYPTGPRPQMHYQAGGVHGTAVPEARAATGATPAVAPDAGPRRVRLSVSRIDPWSIMKLAFLLAVAVAVMNVVATAVVWYVLNDLGVFATIQNFIRETVGAEATVNIIQFVEFDRMISLATLISLVNIVLMTAIATIMAILYNITAALVGGIHLTLTDE